jgi:asparagine synthase (glutamine-hydrolysing)
MFAFCIWDSVKQVLFLARDHMGVKPLYYHSTPGALLFASEIRSITASGLLATKIDPIGLYNYLSFGRSQSPQTILAGIQELKPAHYLLVDANTGNMTERPYWTPFGHGSSITSNIQSEVTELIKESVALQMVSDVPLGAFLSGGIDSSAVTGILSQLHNLPVKTLSIVFKEKEYDESEYSGLVAMRFATDHHILHLGESDLLNALPNAISAMDQPTIDGINTYLISRSAREAGLTVALSGLGGDELFGGYDSFRTLPKLSELGKLIRLLPASLQHLAGNLVRILGAASDRNVKLSHFLSGNINGGHI